METKVSDNSEGRKKNSFLNVFLEIVLKYIHFARVS
jgi:hypothetical protein